MPSDRANRRRAVITGGGSGIGYACASKLAAAGCDVFIAGRRTHLLREASSAISKLAPAALVGYLSVDLTNADSPSDLVETAVALLGGLDILVNAAGAATRVPTQNLTAESWNATVDVTLRGAALCSVAAARHMMAAGGRIVVITSIDSEQSEPNVAHYCAAKAGLGAFARSMAVDLARFNIVVNSVAPGWVETAATADELVTAGPGGMARVNPLARAGTPEEIANVVCYLALDAHSYLTGASITVDGGQTVMAARP